MYYVFGAPSNRAEVDLVRELTYAMCLASRQWKDVNNLDTMRKFSNGLVWRGLTKRIGLPGLWILSTFRLHEADEMGKLWFGDRWPEQYAKMLLVDEMP